MLSVILLSVVALASILQMNKFLQEAQANTTGTSVKSFILQAHGKDLNVIMLSVIVLSVMALASSHPFEQIPARGTGQLNIYVCKKFYNTGPWKGS
jgi:hypothetical protein